MIINDLLSILRGDEPLKRLGTDFIRMLELIETMFRDVNVGLWSGQLTDETVDATFARDVQLNQLERSARKEVINHLVIHKGQGDLPYCFVLINVVKDAERIGDYIKNLVEIRDLGGLPEEETPERMELRALGMEIEKLVERLGPEFQGADSETTTALVRHAKELRKRADGLIPAIAQANLGSRETTVLVLTTRYYKRIAGHAGNILSSVIMPLHKIDYFDEDELDV